MDSDQRHELQENDLKEFIFHFNKFWNKYGTQVLLVILIIVAGVVGVRWYKGKEFREQEAAWADFAGSSSPEGLMEVAQRYGDRPGLASFALLRAADLLAEQAAAVPATDDAKSPDATKTSAEERNRLLERSVQLAQQAVDAKQAADPSLVKLNARMRLASNYETLGEWDKAADQYKAIRTEAGPYKMLASEADLRLQDLPTLKQPVVLPVAPPAPKADAKASDEKPADGTAKPAETATPAPETPAPAAPAPDSPAQP